MKEEFDDEMICPHCRHIEHDAWEFDDDCGETVCNHCEKKFYYNRSRYIKYHTKEIEG